MALPSEPPEQAPAPVVVPTSVVSLGRFFYTAQTERGLRLSGDIEAVDGATAVQALEAMHLRVMHVAAVKPSTDQAQKEDSFLAFNQPTAMHRRLQAALWRSVAYPLTTLVGLLVVLTFIGAVVMPRFEENIADMHLELPLATQVVARIGHAAPFLLGAITIVAGAGGLLWMILRGLGAQAIITDRLLLPAPFIGPVLRYDLIARWLDAMRIAVAAGLDLPAAIRRAGEATASPKLRGDGEQLIAMLVSGMPLTGARCRLVPDTVPAAIESAATHHPLPDTLQTLCDLYTRQAELRLERLPSVLTPILIIIIALLVGIVIFGILMPLALYIDNLTLWIRGGVRF